MQTDNITHLLTVNIYQPGTPAVRKQIQQEVFSKINNVPIEYMCNGMNIIITWQSNTDSHEYYHADVRGLLGDTAVHLHTEMLLAGLLPDLNAKFNNIFDNEARIGFTVTKPLSRSYALSNIDITGNVC